VPISAGAAQRWEQSYVSTVGRLASKILEVVEVRYKFKAARMPCLTCDALPQQHTKIVHFYVYSAIAYAKTLRRFHFDSKQGRLRILDGRWISASKTRKFVKNWVSIQFRAII